MCFSPAVKKQPEENRETLLCLLSSCVVYPIPAIAVLAVNKISLLTNSN